VCRITTDDGLRGIGEARGAPLDQICEVIDTVFRPELLGRHAAETEHLWQVMHDSLLGADAPTHRWSQRTVLAALAAIDLALCDLKAKAAGLSVCRLLGGQPRTMPAYLSEGFYVEGQSLAEMAGECAAGLEAGGYRALKIRLGRDPDDDVARVRAVREAIGDDVDLMVDVNQRWSPEQAKATLPRLEEYNLFWLEEPTPVRRTPADFTAPDRLAGGVARLTTISLASGENHTTLAECRSLVENAPLRYMQFDATKNGGVTEFLKVAALCQAHGIPLAPHHVAHFHVQLAAAMPNGFIVETFDNAKQHLAWPDLFPGYPAVRDGMMQVPDGPGWGMEINDELVERRGVKVNWRG
jgi:L-alanine-DL-glutamate epimerase-like enolase superfamily enzyme